MRRTNRRGTNTRYGNAKLLTGSKFSRRISSYERDEHYATIPPTAQLPLVIGATDLPNFRIPRLGDEIWVDDDNDVEN